MTMFVGHMAVILVFSNILFIIGDYIRNKKINKTLIIYLACSIIGTLFMLLSPGSLHRSAIENIGFAKLSIFNKIIYNIPNFIYYTFIVNSFLFILMSIGNYYLINKNLKKKISKILLNIYVLIIPIMTAICYNLDNLLNIKCDFFINQNNKLLVLYYFSYLVINLFLIFISTKKDKKYTILFFYIIGIVSNVIMMVSPTWGYRTSLSTYIFLGISMLMIIYKYINNKKNVNYILYLFVIIFSCFYLVLYVSVYLQYNDNLKIINKGIDIQDKTIKIYKYPYFSNCNINSENEFHLKKFKEYYNINSDVEIKLIDNNWKNLIFYNK